MKKIFNSGPALILVVFFCLSFKAQGSSVALFLDKSIKRQQILDNAWLWWSDLELESELYLKSGKNQRDFLKLKKAWQEQYYAKALSLELLIRYLEYFVESQYRQQESKDPFIVQAFTTLWPNLKLKKAPSERPFVPSFEVTSREVTMAVEEKIKNSELMQTLAQNKWPTLPIVNFEQESPRELWKKIKYHWAHQLKAQLRVQKMQTALLFLSKYYAPPKAYSIFELNQLYKKAQAQVSVLEKKTIKEGYDLDQVIDSIYSSPLLKLLLKDIQSPSLGYTPLFYFYQHERLNYYWKLNKAKEIFNRSLENFDRPSTHEKLAYHFSTQYSKAQLFIKAKEAWSNFEEQNDPSSRLLARSYQLALAIKNRDHWQESVAIFETLLADHKGHLKNQAKTEDFYLSPQDRPLSKWASYHLKKVVQKSNDPLFKALVNLRADFVQQQIEKALKDEKKEIHINLWPWSYETETKLAQAQMGERFTLGLQKVRAKLQRHKWPKIKIFPTNELPQEFKSIDQIKQFVLSSLPKEIGY